MNEDNLKKIVNAIKDIKLACDLEYHEQMDEWDDIIYPLIGYAWSDQDAHEIRGALDAEAS